jgi:hypothetical protein
MLFGVWTGAKFSPTPSPGSPVNSLPAPSPSAVQQTPFWLPPLGGEGWGGGFWRAPNNRRSSEPLLFVVRPSQEKFPDNRFRSQHTRPMRTTC